jgi:putative FmdB family regulatory protein
MTALYSRSAPARQQKTRKITVFLLLFLRSCAACKEMLNDGRRRVRGSARRDRHDEFVRATREDQPMPIYEYLCERCGHEFETIQKFSEAPLRECPACHEAALVKKVSAAGFRLKGGGWYETDFKSGSKRNVAGDSGGGDSAGSSSAGTAETKTSSDSTGSAKAAAAD